MTSPEACQNDGDNSDKQKIVWENNKDFLSSSIHGSNVFIDVGCLDHSALGSSAVVTTSVTDYPFMVPGPYSNGFAMHRTRRFLAYAINKVSSGAGGSSHGMVRVIETGTNKRCLIRGSRGLVMDMSFAWILETVLIAFTDTTGAFYVYQVTSLEQEKDLSTRLILEVCMSPSNQINLLEDFSCSAPVAPSLERQHRVAWCHYVPEAPADPPQPLDLAPPHLLAVILGNKVEIWQLYRLWQQQLQDNGDGVHVVRGLRLDPEQSALLHVFCFSSPVTATAISPDSTCIAIATHDGLVRFYQVDGGGRASDDEAEEDNGDCDVAEAEEADCVHEWEPHDRQPVTCLHFLDDQAGDDSISSPCSFWKFAVTGTRGNTELKFWSCKTWTCLQVLQFHLPPVPLPPSQPSNSGGITTASAPSSASHSPSLRSASLSPSMMQQSSPCPVVGTAPRFSVYVDDTANYMVLTDQSRKVLYIVMLDYTVPFSCSAADGVADALTEQDAISSTEASIKRVVSVTEIPVQFVPLCVCITSAKMKVYQRWKHHTTPDVAIHESSEEAAGGESLVRGLALRCYVLTTKSLSQCSVRLQPSLPSSGRAQVASRTVTSKSRDIQLKSSAATENGDSKHGVMKEEESEVTANGGQLVENLLDITSSTSSFKDVHDGLTDLSMSLSECDLSHTAACLLPTTADGTPPSQLPLSTAASAPSPSPLPATTLEGDTSKLNSDDEATAQLGGLLTPLHFSSSSPAKASAPHVRDMMAVATASLPMPPDQVTVDPSLNNTPNATLAALLSCPNIQQASAIIAGAQPPSDKCLLMGTVPLHDDSPSSMMASLLGIARSVEEATHSTAQPKPSLSITSNNATDLCSSSISSLVGAVVQASSSTSSPSLEIQQILQQTDKSSSSSGSSSRGPTQLEMAEEDSHLHSSSQSHHLQHLFHSHPVCDDDQPEALRQMPNTELVFTTCVAATSASVPLQTSDGSVARSSSNTGLLRSYSAAAASNSDTIATTVEASEQEKQRLAVRQIHQRFIGEQLIRDRKRDQERLLQIQQQQQQVQQERLALTATDSSALLSPHSAASPPTCTTPTNRSSATIVPPSEPSPSTSDFLQALLPGFQPGATTLDTSVTALPAPKVLEDLFGAGENLSKFTCEQLEAQIKGDPIAAVTTPSATSTTTTITSTACSGNGSILNQISTSVSNGQLSEQSPVGTTTGRPLMTPRQQLQPANSRQPTSYAELGASLNSALLGAIRGERSPNRSSNTASCQSAAAGAIGVHQGLTSASVGGNAGSAVAPTDVSASSGITDAVSVASDALLRSRYSNTGGGGLVTVASNTTISTSSVAVQQSVDTTSVAVQAAPPQPPPPTVICKHPADSHSAELKELRSLLLSTQQQVNKLSKKLDEMTLLQKNNNPQAVATALRPAVEASLRSELRHTLPHSVSKGLESAVGQQLPHELQRMVTATEARLADNISKMIHSRSFTESLTSSVCGAVAPSVTAACREAYTKLVLPGFNTLTSRMMQQCNDLFHKGTSEYLLQVQGEVSGMVQRMDSCKSNTVREMEASKTGMAALLKAHQDLVQQHQAAMHQHASHVVSEATIRQVVAEEVQRCVGALQRAVTHPPGTPAPIYGQGGPDKPQSPKQQQLQLEQLIAAKQFNSAFKQALSANDLSLVLFVCERVNRESLMMSGNCKLSQEVLMSLINQLSHDLAQKTDLKMKFLEDALLCLEPHHPVTREHIKTVCVLLQRNVQLYLDTGPPQHTQNRFRMLLLAATHHVQAAAVGTQ